MIYKIGDLVFRSQIEFPSYQVFTCENCDADVTLELTEYAPEEGTEYKTGRLSTRKIQAGWFFHIVSDKSHGLITSSDYTRLSLVREGKQQISPDEEWFVQIALECVLIKRGYLSLHAACVELEGKAIAFSGPSGIGKSTRAGNWVDVFGAETISGDRPLIHVRDLEIYGVPWDGKESCFRNVHYPLQYICEIRRSDSVYIKELTFDEKRRFLLQQCFLPMWDTNIAARAMVSIFQLASYGRIIRTYFGPEEKDAIKLKTMLDLNMYNGE